METWHLWIIAGIIFLIIEVISFTFISASIAVGCIAAATTSYLQLSFNDQIIAFSLSLLVNFFTVRSFVYKKFRHSNLAIKTNADALVGKEGKVHITINNSRNEGRIMVEGCDWKAESNNNSIIEKDQKVTIIKVNSTILTVKTIS